MANDWDIIKIEYIQGFVDEKGNIKRPTLKELANRHSCSESRVKHQSAKGKWKHQRKLFIETRVEKIQEKKLEVLVNEAVELNSESLKASKMGIKAVIESFTEPDLKPYDIQKLSIALINLHKVGLLALGEPTERVKNDNKHEMIENETFKDPNIQADLSGLYKSWDEKTDKSSGLGEG